MKSYRGIRPAGNSIKISFYYRGRRLFVTWPFQPTAANLAAANVKRKAALNDINLERLGLARFDIAAHFKHYRARTGPDAAERTHTVETVLRDWWAGAHKKLAASTAPKFRGYVNEFIVFFGAGTAIADVDAARIDAWVSGQQQRVLSMKTIDNKLIVLRGALEFAKRDLHAIEVNPLVDVGRIKPTEEQRIQKKLTAKKVDPFDVDEIQKVLRVESGWLGNFFQFAIWTGLRLGELFALTWEDFDFVHNTVHVSWSYTEHKLTPQKTDGSDRIIELNDLPGAAEAMRRQKALTFMLPARATKIGERRFMFMNPATCGPFTHAEQLRITRWPNMLRRAGVRYRYPYQCRHTFASLMLVSGKTPEWVANNLGHRDVEMVYKHYSKFLKQASKLFGAVSNDRLDQLSKILTA